MTKEEAILREPYPPKKVDIGDRIRCNGCGNYERFYARRSPEDDVMSKSLIIQKRGKLYVVKGSVERVQCGVPQFFYQKPHVVRLCCTECGEERSRVNHPTIDIDRIEKEYWRFDNE